MKRIFSRRAFLKGSAAAAGGLRFRRRSYWRRKHFRGRLRLAIAFGLGWSGSGCRVRGCWEGPSRFRSRVRGGG